MTILLIIIGIILFNLIIFVHELGHFISALSFGIKVNEFALGMGPRILKYERNGIIFSLRAFPIGGFCEMEGEDEESSSPSSFNKKTVWQKIIVIAAGAVMNIILGFLMTMLLLAQNDKFASTTVSKFSEQSVSETSGLQIGDEIISVDGNRISTYKDLIFSLSADGKSQFYMKVIRHNQTIILEEVTFNTIQNDKGKSSTQIDFYVQPIEKNFLSFLKQSYFDTISTIKIVWMSLIGMINGRFAVNNITGPIGIVSVIGEATTEGLKTSFLAAINNIVSIMAMITLNLGVVNLLPLPALDGGRLLFLLVELITRKKLKPKHEGYIHTIGFFLLIALMVLIAYWDVIKLLGKA